MTGGFLSNEKLVIGTLLRSLKDTGKPFIMTSGTAILGDTGDRIFDEETTIPPVGGEPFSLDLKWTKNFSTRKVSTVSCSVPRTSTAGQMGRHCWRS